MADVSDPSVPRMPLELLREIRQSVSHSLALIDELIERYEWAMRPPPNMPEELRKQGRING